MLVATLTTPRLLRHTTRRRMMQVIRRRSPRAISSCMPWIHLRRPRRRRDRRQRALPRRLFGHPDDDDRGHGELRRGADRRPDRRGLLRRLTFVTKLNSALATMVSDSSSPGWVIRATRRSAADALGDLAVADAAPRRASSSGSSRPGVPCPNVTRPPSSWRDAPRRRRGSVEPVRSDERNGGDDNGVGAQGRLAFGEGPRWRDGGGCGSATSIAGRCSPLPRTGPRPRSSTCRLSRPARLAAGRTAARLEHDRPDGAAVGAGRDVGRARRPHGIRRSPCQ